MNVVNIDKNSKYIKRTQKIRVIIMVTRRGNKLSYKVLLVEDDYILSSFI